jgi:hypothetical protein
MMKWITASRQAGFKGIFRSRLLSLAMRFPERTFPAPGSKSFGVVSVNDIASMKDANLLDLQNSLTQFSQTSWPSCQDLPSNALLLSNLEPMAPPPLATGSGVIPFSYASIK